MHESDVHVDVDVTYGQVARLPSMTSSCQALAQLVHESLSLVDSYADTVPDATPRLAKRLLLELD